MASDHVTLSVPAKGEWARTVRMTASSVATGAGASVELLEEIRLAVDEAYVHACETGSPSGRIDMEFEIGPGEFRLRIGPLNGPRPAPDGGEAEVVARYSRFIIEAVCDEFEEDCEDDSVYLVLCKRLTPAE